MYNTILFLAALAPVALAWLLFSFGMGSTFKRIRFFFASGNDERKREREEKNQVIHMSLMKINQTVHKLGLVGLNNVMYHLI